MLNNGVVAPLLSLFKSDIGIEELRNVVWTIYKLCKKWDLRPPFQVVKQFLPTIAQLVCHQDHEVQANACWALSSLAGGSNEEIQEVIDTGVIPHLIQLLDSGHLPVVSPSLISIGNIVTGNDMQTDEVLKYDALLVLAKLLKHPEPYIVQQASWTISNITAGNRTQINKVIYAGCLQPLINIFIKAQVDAVLAVASLTTGDKIKALQSHENEIIRENVHKILKNVFPEDQEEDNEH